MGITLAALILLAGATGASLRYAVSLVHSTYGGELHHWPIGTLTANIVASFAMGLLSAASSDGSTALAVGGLGALSTWSTVALEAKTRIDAGHWGTALVYLTVSLIAAVTSAWLGLQLA